MIVAIQMIIFCCLALFIALRTHYLRCRSRLLRFTTDSMVVLRCK